MKHSPELYPKISAASHWVAHITIEYKFMHKTQAGIIELLKPGKTLIRINIPAWNFCVTHKINNHCSAENEHLFYYCISRQFNHCVNIIGYTYRNPDGVRLWLYRPSVQSIDLINEVNDIAKEYHSYCLTILFSWTYEYTLKL